MPSPKNKKETFKDLLARLKQDSVSSPVKVATLKKRKYFLIVTEGVRTEPIYFNYIKKMLPKYLIDTVEVSGAGDNTVNVVKIAIEERNKRLADKLKPKFDEVWAVYDKDDFPHRRFNDAEKIAIANSIESGHTNQAFELWYVLHFQFLDTKIDRNAYFDILSGILKNKYKKNDENTVAQIFRRGDVATAIRHANTLEKMHKGKTPAKSWPVTRVHHLVQKLLKYADTIE